MHKIGTKCKIADGKRYKVIDVIMATLKHYRKQKNRYIMGIRGNIVYSEEHFCPPDLRPRIEYFRFDLKVERIYYLPYGLGSLYAEEELYA